MGAGHGRSNRAHAGNSTENCNYHVPPVGDDRNQLAACLASISDIALAGKLQQTDGDEPPSGEQLSRDRAGNGSSGTVSGSGRSLRLRLKQRLQRNRSQEEGQGVVGDIATTGGDGGSMYDEVARNHRQLLDSLDSQDDDSTDWATMRQWLVWCLHEKLGDTELQLFNDRRESRGRRRLLRQKNQLHSSCSSSHKNDHSADNDDEVNIDNDDVNSFRSSSAIVQLDYSLSSSPLLHQPTPTSSSSLLVPLITSIPASNPRLVRQHAVHERSPRASYSSDGGDAFIYTGATIGQSSRQRGRLQSDVTYGRGQSMPPPRNRFSSSDVPRRPSAYIGSRGRGNVTTMTATNMAESGVERLTVNDASYSAGSSFDSYGSTG